MNGTGLRTVTAAFFAVTLLLGGSAWAQETVTIPGSGACQSLLKALAAEFTSANPGITVEIPDSTGTGGGIKSATDDSADLGRVGRKLKDSEKGYGLEYKAFAKMPVVFAAHPSVPTVDISAAQARDIFTGKITNWKEVGGPDMKIRVISRHSNEAGLLVLKADLPGWADIELTTKSKLGSSDQEAIEFIESIDGAIGYGTYDQVAEADLTVLNLDGVSATDPSYPANIEFGLVYKPARLKGATKSFVDYLSTADAAKVMKSNFASPIAR